jgi:ankyrin repeat protein
VQLLLDNAAPVNAKDDENMTPLHRIAGSFGGTYFAELLIKKGASVNAVDEKGRTPLDLAKDDDMKDLLHKHGAKTGKELQEEDK